MLSRIAGTALQLMRRYAERADGILRMLRINFITSLDHNPDFRLATGRMFTTLSDAEIEALAKDSDAVLRYVICNRENANSIRNIAARARENARGIQDHVTKEVWESLNAFYHKVNGVEVEAAIERKEQIVMLGELLNHCLLFFGVSDVTMPRGQGWNYMNLGKFVERGIQTADMLKRALATSITTSTTLPTCRTGATSCCLCRVMNCTSNATTAACKAGTWRNWPS